MLTQLYSNKVNIVIFIYRCSWYIKINTTNPMATLPRIFVPKSWLSPFALPIPSNPYSTPSIWQRSQKHTLEKRQHLQPVVMENWVSTCRWLKLDPCLSPCTKINSKWIKDLSLQHESWKLPEENIGSILCDTGIGKDFQNWQGGSLKTKKLLYI